VAVAILQLASAPEDASRRMMVLKYQPTGRKGVAVRPDDTEKSVMVVRGAARKVAVEAPCDGSEAMAKQPSRV
jgi:hypothetical protein